MLEQLSASFRYASALQLNAEKNIFQRLDFAPFDVTGHLQRANELAFESDCANASDCSKVRGQLTALPYKALNSPPQQYRRQIKDRQCQTNRGTKSGALKWHQGPSAQQCARYKTDREINHPVKEPRNLNNSHHHRKSDRNKRRT
jgi:hypothetical protein